MNGEIIKECEAKKPSVIWTHVHKTKADDSEAGFKHELRKTLGKLGLDIFPEFAVHIRRTQQQIVRFLSKQQENFQNMKAKGGTHSLTANLPNMFQMYSYMGSLNNTIMKRGESTNDKIKLI